MTAVVDPFKKQDRSTKPKQAVVLSKVRLDRMIKNSMSIQDEREKERARLEELRKRQEKTKSLSRKVVHRKKPGAELRKQMYDQAAKEALREVERSSRIEARKSYVLDLAYKKLFEETDRVKNFKVAKNLAATLKERDDQVRAKAGMQDVFLNYEKQFVIGMLKDVEEHEREEKDKLEKKKRDKLINAENWNKQRDEAAKKKIDENWEHLRDGYQVREAANAHAEEMENSKLRQKKKIRDYKAELDRQRDKKLAIMDVSSRLDEADDKRAKIFNDAKQEMVKKHKEIKEEIDKKKAMKKETVAKNMKDEMAAIKSKEEEVLRKAIREAEVKFRDECAIKKANRDEALKGIEDFYHKEMEAKARRDLDKRIEEFQERRNIFEDVEKRQNAEDSKQRRHKDMEEETQHLQLHQIAKRNRDKMAVKLEDMKDYLNHMRSLDDEEEVFQKYAQMEIASFESRGIDTKPMQFAARPGIECGKGPLYEHRGHIRPKYYSSIAKGDELNHIKRDTKKPNSKSRMGFMLH